MLKRSVVVLAVFFVLAVSGIAQAQSERMEKAEEYLETGMPDQATEILREEIKENPSNADAHFMLGTLYLRRSNNFVIGGFGKLLQVCPKFEKAMERFKSAVNIDESYKEKIYEEALLDFFLSYTNADESVVVAKHILAEGMKPLSLYPRALEDLRAKVREFFEKKEYERGDRIHSAIYRVKPDRALYDIHKEYIDKLNYSPGHLFLIKRFERYYGGYEGTEVPGFEIKKDPDSYFGKRNDDYILMVDIPSGESSTLEFKDFGKKEMSAWIVGKSSRLGKLGEKNALVKVEEGAVALEIGSNGQSRLEAGNERYIPGGEKRFRLISLEDGTMATVEVRQ